MRTLIVCLTLAVAGCGNPNDWGNNSGGVDNTTMSVLAGTAFLNGYNNARPAMVMCQHVGMMTLCQ